MRTWSAIRLPVTLALLVATSDVRAASPTVPECLAASEEALSLRHGEQLTAARQRLLVCSSSSCPRDVRTECLRVLDEVVAVLPTLVFDVKSDQGDDLAGVQVTMDGAPIAQGTEGTALTVDPGPHQFTFQLRGRVPLEKSIVVHEGDKARHESIVLTAAGDTGAVAPPEPAAPADAGNTASPRRTIAIAVGAVGALGLIVGGVSAAVASSEWSDAKRDCGAGCAAGSPAQGERSTALAWAGASTAGFIVGGLGVAAGGILWFTAPRRTDATRSGWTIYPAVGPNGSGVLAQGTF